MHPSQLTQYEPLPDQSSADTFDVRAALWRVWEAAWAHKLLIALTTAVCVGLVVAYVVVFPPVYSAHVLVMAEDEQDPARDAFYGQWAVFRQNDIQTEAAMMTARPVLEAVVRDLGLTYQDVYHPPLHYLGHLWTQSWLGSRYHEFKDWLFEPQPSPYAPTDEEIDFARTVIDFQSGVGVQPLPETNAGHVWVRGPSPRVAEIANVLVDTYFAQRRARQLDEARKANEALKAEVARALADVQAIQKKREEFFASHDMILMFDKDKLELTTLFELEAGVLGERSSLLGLKQKLDKVEAQLAQEPHDIVASRVVTRNPLLDTMKAYRYQLASSLDQALLQYRPDSPEVQDIRAMITATDERIAATETQVEQSSTHMVNATYEALRQQRLTLVAAIAATKVQLEEREQALADMHARLSDIPATMRVSYELAREENILEKKHQVLQEKQMQAEVFLDSAAAAPSPMRVIADAVAPAKPSWPNTKVLVAAALVLGVCAGTALAVLIDTLRERVTRSRLAQSSSDVLVYARLESSRRISRRVVPRLIAVAPDARVLDDGRENGLS